MLDPIQSARLASPTVLAALALLFELHRARLVAYALDIAEHMSRVGGVSLATEPGLYVSSTAIHSAVGVVEVAIAGHVATGDPLEVPEPAPDPEETAPLHVACRAARIDARAKLAEVVERASRAQQLGAEAAGQALEARAAVSGGLGRVIVADGDKPS